MLSATGRFLARGIGLAVVLVGGLCPPGAVAADAAADGERYVFILDTPGQLVIRDDRTSRVRHVAVDPACRLSPSASAGRALLNCRLHPPATTPQIVSARDGSVRSVDTPNADTTSYTAVGRYWLAGTSCLNGCSPAYLNWRTGEYRNAIATTAERDLDEPDLPIVDVRRGVHVRFERPSRDARPRLVLYQDGRHHLLSRCLQSCSSIQLAGTWVSWAEGRNTARAYRVSDGRRFRRTVRPSAPAGQVLSVSHTRRRLYIVVPRGPLTPRIVSPGLPVG
ncbi:MAG: hypothetical protein JWO74_4091 [Solirubrobacterales bacterium]|nr:hypothetical protein [Solirubrobacterales bacterium]